jgi:hypothetical protein
VVDVSKPPAPPLALTDVWPPSPEAPPVLSLTVLLEPLEHANSATLTAQNAFIPIPQLLRIGDLASRLIPR